MIKTITLIAFCIVMIGCDGGVVTEAKTDLDYAVLNAPHDAKNMTALGHGWYTFTLTTEGKTRQFLWKKRNPGLSSSTECITELSQ